MLVCLITEPSRRVTEAESRRSRSGLQVIPSCKLQRPSPCNSYTKSLKPTNYLCKESAECSRWPAAHPSYMMARRCEFIQAGAVRCDRFCPRCDSVASFGWPIVRVCISVLKRVCLQLQIKFLSHHFPLCQCITFGLG